MGDFSPTVLENFWRISELKFRSFVYPIPGDGLHDELNAFLTSHRVVDARAHLAQEGRFLVFVVEYLEGKAADSGRREPRVDYREKLSEAGFAVFSRLRDHRKKIAEEEGVPVYNVFTNAQLAELVAKRVTTRTALAEIAGVGTARVEKYGDAILALCTDLMEGLGE